MQNVFKKTRKISLPGAFVKQADVLMLMNLKCFKFVLNTVAVRESFALVTQEEGFLVLQELVSLQIPFEKGWTLLNKIQSHA